jgi:thiamine-phosphate pyrophosphorylase
LIPQQSQPLLYLITDRLKLPRPANKSAFDALSEFARQAFLAGVDLLQVRERDLSGRQLFLLTRHLADIARAHNAQVLVNDRADIAAACDGVGVHLTTRSIQVGVVRKAFGDDLLIGASTHTLSEAREAEDGGANFIVFGPVFATESKQMYGEPVGVEALQEVTAEVRIPVLALGGIKLSNFKNTLNAGAKGIAAISLFTDSNDLQTIVQTLKKQG